MATEQIHKLIPDPMVKHLFGRILAVMRSRGTDYPTESEEGFGTLAFGAMKPQTTAEVLLCSQMVAIWEVGMGMLTAAKLADDDQALSEKGNLAAKLLGLYERQFVALTKARKPPQVVTVEHVHKHLHVNGRVPGSTGEVTIIGGQPYESTTPAALALAAAPEMLGETPEVACPVPSPGDEKRPLPKSTAAPLQAHQAVSAMGCGGMVDIAASTSKCGEPFEFLLREARKTVATF